MFGEYVDWILEGTGLCQSIRDMVAWYHFLWVYPTLWLWRGCCHCPFWWGHATRFQLQWLYRLADLGEVIIWGTMLLESKKDTFHHSLDPLLTLHQLMDACSHVILRWRILLWLKGCSWDVYLSRFERRYCLGYWAQTYSPRWGTGGRATLLSLAWSSMRLLLISSCSRDTTSHRSSDMDSFR